MEEKRTLEEVLEDGYQVVTRTDDFVVVQRFAEDDQPPPQPLQQLSASMGGETRYVELAKQDYNPDFIHDSKTLYDTVREMRNDGQIRNSLRLAKSPVLGARWFVKPASQDAFDVEVADFIQSNLDEWMTTSFFHLMVESLLSLDYGWYLFEKVFDVREVNGEQKIVWRKFVPIHPMDVRDINYGDDGGPESVTLEDENETEIPIEKLLIFSFDMEGGNMFGTSILRSAYKHYFFKENLYKIDAIQKERHGVGVPIIKLPMNATATDRTLAHSIGMNLRSNERAHVVIPPLWEIEFAKLEGQRVDALASAQHHGEMIYENVMGRGVMNTMSSRTDMSASAEMFLKSSRYIAEIIKDVWNKYAIPQLCRWNWDEFPNGYPELDVRRLGDTTDWRQMSFAMRNFVGMSALTPDDALEEWVRDEMDLPLRDESSARELPTGTGQQVPGSTSSGARTGLPRQTPNANVARGTGGPSTGRDSTGV